ncbi:hypothetical protein TWF481_000622 [Arthrobotrys musiformis]|uniref:RBR-type E3 ubiquitin transferase n=1 Tax=Arthrobotrys musiformis TaxID=47236 RepID=A0AAV9WNA2_9PEZI
MAQVHIPTAGPSRSRRFNPIPDPVVPDVEADPVSDDLLLALTLQLEELDIESQTRKGKGRVGEVSDRHVALQDYKDLLQSMSQIQADQRMAKSIADAVLHDSAALDEFTAMEAAAVRDHEQAVRMQEQLREEALRVENNRQIIPTRRTRSAFTSTAAPSSYSRSLRGGGGDYDDLESVSAYTDYEPQTRFPNYTIDDDLESTYSSNRGSTSRRLPVQASNMKYHTGPRVECSICFDRVPQSNSAKCPCKHIYCRDCLRNYVFRAMKDESLYPLKCCKIEVPSNVIATILTPAEYKRYQDTAVEYSTSNRVYCPNKNCLQFIPPESVNDVGNFAVCEHCSAIACTKCKNMWHGGACKVDFDLIAATATARQEGWRQCYNCNRMIELSGGCHHMTCHCKAEFCYVCGVQWKNCECPLFEERRLYADAVARVDEAAPRPLAPVVRNNMIFQAQRQIRENLACEHPQRFHKVTERKPDGYTCSVCRARHWKYIFTCRHCGIEVCEECRRFRMV